MIPPMSNSKVVWITGATSGIGEQLAYLYSSQGDQIIISARREEELNRVQKNCAHPSQVLVLPLDLTQPGNFLELAQSVMDTFGRIDILINNGGISQRSQVHETPLEIDRQVMEVNYFGNIALTKAILPYLRQQKSGIIVPISSLAGQFGFYLRSAYSASKHALHGFYETLRLEEFENNIQVTLICPALIRTNISLEALDANGKPTGKMDKNQETGMDPKLCAQKIIKAIQKKKLEALIGNGEQNTVRLKRWFPRLFFKIIKSKKPD